MKKFAVIDTNVLVPALLKYGSIPYMVLQETLRGKIIPIVNDEIIEEYMDVLCRPKFKFDKGEVRALLDDFAKRAVYGDGEIVEDFLPDPKDVVFYSVVMEQRKSSDAYLVTGNLKHFPAKPFVVTPREMLAIVREADE